MITPLVHLEICVEEKKALKFPKSVRVCFIAKHKKREGEVVEGRGKGVVLRCAARAKERGAGMRDKE